MIDLVEFVTCREAAEIFGDIVSISLAIFGLSFTTMVSCIIGMKRTKKWRFAALFVLLGISSATALLFGTAGMTHLIIMTAR